MKPIRLLAIFAAAAICAVMPSCDNTDEPAPSGAEPVSSNISSAELNFRLPYCAGDSLNPYTAETKINRELSSLMYDSLVVLDGNMQPQYRLADSITLSNGEYVIKLRQAVFSDGTPVTAEDVTWSISAALKSEYKYKDQLASVASYNAADSKTLTIKLSAPDADFVSMLDFPVYKMNTDKLKNSDNKSLPPTGSGRYIYTADGGTVTLTANDSWIGGAVSVKTVELVNTPDSNALVHKVESSGISMYYTDLSDGTVPSWSGKLTGTPLANIVYLGVNSARGALGKAEVRRALSSAVDRTALSENVFYSYADAAEGIYPNAFYRSAGLQHISASADVDAAAAELAAAGFTEKDGEGYIVQDGARLKFNIVVNSGNASRTAAASAIKNQLRTVGIEAEVISLPDADYTARIAAGDYDMYIGEIKLPKNMDLSAFFADGGAGSGGIDPASAAKAKYAEYKAGTAELADFIEVFEQELPVIPLCWRGGLLCYASELPNVPQATLSDIYYNIQDYIAASGQE